MKLLVRYPSEVRGSSRVRQQVYIQAALKTPIDRRLGKMNIQHYLTVSGFEGNGQGVISDTFDTVLSETLADIISDIDSGVNISQAFAPYKSDLSPYFNSLNEGMREESTDKYKGFGLLEDKQDIITYTAMVAERFGLISKERKDYSQIMKYLPIVIEYALVQGFEEVMKLN
jgi:hypothetical protein